MNQITKYISLFAAVLLLQSCGMWTNFTTYFNVYYNATVALETAEESIEAEKTELFEFRPAPLKGNSRGQLQKVIEKCSRILQFNSESDYFDDALFLIGKSFYYQQDYSKSLRKFNELAGLPETELNLDSRLWVGKCQLQLRDFDNGIATLESVIEEADAQERNDLIVDANIVRISYLISREDYENAVQRGRELIAASDDEELNAEVAYEMGKLFVKMEDIGKAVESFAEALSYSPTFEIEFYSKFEFARGRAQLGFEDESLQLLQDLRDEDKYEDYFDMVELEIAEIHEKRGEFDTAMEMYTVIDTTYKKTESAGMAQFHKGQLWETVYGKYDSAKIYYDRTNQNKNVIQETRNSARTKSLTITKYQKVRDELSSNMKGIQYLVDSTLFVQDSTDYAFYMERKKAYEDSLKEFNMANAKNKNNRNNRQQASNPRGGVRQQPALGKNDRTGQGANRNPFPNIPKPEKPKISADSMSVLNDDLKYQIANMFFSELNVPDSARFYYTDIMKGNRNKKIVPQATYALGTYFLTVNEQARADSLFQIVYDKYPQLDIAKDAAKRLNLQYVADDDPAQLLFLSAEEKYLASNYSDAITGYRKLTVDFPESPLAPKALYTIGFIYENDLHLSDSAVVIYDSLSAQYANSEYTRAARPKLQEFKNLIKQQEEAAKADSAVTDSSAFNPDTPDLQPEREEAAEEAQIDSTANSAQKKLKEEILPELKKAMEEKNKPEPKKKKKPPIKKQ